MNKLSCDLILENELIGVNLYAAALDSRVTRTMPRLSPAEWVFHSFTATTDMRDFIGNVTKIEGEKYSVKGVYRGKMLELRNVKSHLKFKLNERVMVTEHVDINGKFGFLASKKRILIGNINFVNVGWSDEKKSRQLSIDIYTGEVRELIGPPIPPSIRIGKK